MPQNPQPNFNAMRQDAIRRSREMQRRAGQGVHAPSPAPQTQVHKPPEAAPHSALPQELQNLLSGWDGERIALLALLYFLYKEGTDAKLLLAIAYILL